MGVLNFLEYLMYKIENDMETEPERWTEATKQMKVKEHRCILYLLNDPSLHALQAGPGIDRKAGQHFFEIEPPMHRPGPRISS